MVHVPQILKVSARALKPVALTGVALVQAHPVAAAFTVVAIVGVGLAIFYTKHSKNRKEENGLTYISREDIVYSKDANSYFYDPETKSITTEIPKSTASHEKKALRKRRVAQCFSSTNENNPPHSQEERKSNLTFSIKRENENSGNNINTNYGKVLPNDILKNGKAVTGEEKANLFIRSLSETEVIESNDRPTDESHFIETIEENSIDLSSGSSSQSYWIDYSFLDLTDFRRESSVESLLSEQPDWCRACRISPVNTHMQPCKHRYLCEDCAMRIFGLFKRCTVCRAGIEEIIVETL